MLREVHCSLHRDVHGLVHPKAAGVSQNEAAAALSRSFPRRVGPLKDPRAHGNHGAFALRLSPSVTVAGSP